ncbi:DUF4230 domain-containing protein [Edaphobacter albus]|uniref:DUF4230 domain-containing protein n=1 Tax=Edaphobacter sp. 4G125 TaxID=2763071 RepID=UPI00164693F7|nr:DUF4230 domain-containing protein [Edaphobacter sp. 4G125]QNI36786.1 DUF4230 domain-containing protein [Edaphobacter sp. 4G125]
MTTQYRTARSSWGSLFAFLLALLLGAAALALFLRNATNGTMGHLADRVLGRETAYDTSVPAIVHRIQRLSRLETVVYSLDTIVEGSKSSAVLPDLLAGDRILLVVHGQAIAGIDLSQLKSEDIRITNGNGTRTIHVTLPASQLFSTTLDNQHTRVYARTTGILVPVDQNLESETRAKAELQLQQTALSDGILDTARKNARSTVTMLLYSLGFQKVDVN